MYANTHKIVSSHDILFDKTISSVLAYTESPYSEALDMRPAVSYITYATLSHEQTSGIITFAQFEEGDVVKTNVIQKKKNPFWIQLVNHL